MKALLFLWQRTAPPLKSKCTTSEPKLHPHKINSIKIRAFCIFVVCKQAVIKAESVPCLRVGKVHLIFFIALKSSRC